MCLRAASRPLVERRAATARHQPGPHRMLDLPFDLVKPRRVGQISAPFRAESGSRSFWNTLNSTPERRFVNSRAALPSSLDQAMLLDRIQSTPLAAWAPAGFVREPSQSPFCAIRSLHMRGDLALAGVRLGLSSNQHDGYTYASGDTAGSLPFAESGAAHLFSGEDAGGWLVPYGSSNGRVTELCSDPERPRDA